MRPAARLLIALALLSLAAASLEGKDVTIYIQRVLIADPGEIRLGDLVQTAGEAPAAAWETLAVAVATLAGHLLYIPSRSYMDRIEDAFGREAIFVGSRSLVIPRGAVPDSQVSLLDRLVDFLTDAGMLGGDVADIDVRSVQLAGTLPRDASPAFRMVRSSKTSVEVSFTVPAEGEQTSGRILVGLREDPRAAASDIAASDPVLVVFHKGPITIEMQGKAQGPAAVGDTVSVMVMDSHRTFSGRLLSGKAVDVELP